MSIEIRGAVAESYIRRISSGTSTRRSCTYSLERRVEETCTVDCCAGAKPEGPEMDALGVVNGDAVILPEELRGCGRLLRSKAPLLWSDALAFLQELSLQEYYLVSLTVSADGAD